MHDPEMHQLLPRLWLFAGTGDGPPLAEELLAMGWRVRLSLVSDPAQRAYAAHPQLEVVIGPVGGVASIARALDQARDQGNAFSLVVDATHPFAQTISADLARACCQCNLELLRLHRPAPQANAPREPIQELAGLEELAGLPLKGAKLLLAIGHRQLAQAVAHTPGAIHHARLLPNAASLKAAMAAGLAAERVACLRPTPMGRPWGDSVEAGLLRRWQIEAIVARASGGATEACWRSLASELGLQLILLQRPDLAGDGIGFGQQALLAKAHDRLAQLEHQAQGPSSQMARHQLLQ